MPMPLQLAYASVIVDMHKYNCLHCRMKTCTISYSVIFQATKQNPNWIDIPTPHRATTTTIIAGRDYKPMPYTYLYIPLSDTLIFS